MRGVDSDLQMAESVISPMEHRSSVRIRIARSTGQILPIRFVTSTVHSGMATVRISGCRLPSTGRRATSSIASS